MALCIRMAICTLAAMAASMGFGDPDHATGKPTQDLEQIGVALASAGVLNGARTLAPESRACDWQAVHRPGRAQKIDRQPLPAVEIPYCRGSTLVIPASRAGMRSGRP